MSTAQPTIAPAASPTPEGTPFPKGCFGATFISDVTIPDGTQVSNDESFVKTWRVKNTGACDWPDNVVLAFKSGDSMTRTSTKRIGPLKSGEQTDVTLVMTAPNSAGAHKSVFQMQDPKGTFFGDEFTVEVVSRIPPTPLPAGYCAVGYVCKSSDGEYMVGVGGFEYRNGTIGYRTVNPGFRWLLVGATVEGVKQTSYNPLYFKVRDSKGVEYNTDTMASVSLTGFLQSGTLQPGERVSGSMAFIVPANDDNLTVIYQPLFRQSVRVQLTK